MAAAPQGATDTQTSVLPFPFPDFATNRAIATHTPIKGVVFVGGNPNATDTTDLGTTIVNGAPTPDPGVSFVTSSAISQNPATFAPAGLPVTPAAVSGAPQFVGSSTTFSLGGFVSTIGADLADPFNHLIVVGIVLLVGWWLYRKVF